jgi:DNA-binding protein Fis
MGLSSLIKTFLKEYFDEHQAFMPDGILHDIIMTEVERPLIETILERTQWNQKKASQMLGINRNTLRKKIQQYALVQGK